MLLGAGLTLRSAAAMSDVALGFDPTSVTKAHVLLPVPRYPDAAARRHAMAAILAQIAAEPGVTAVAAVFPHPFRGAPQAPIASEATAGSDPTQRPQAVPHTISAGYFDALRVPLLAGRAFGASDASGPPIAIVSGALAQRLWPGANAIGRRVRIGDSEEWRTVVGVVGEVRKTITGELLPDVYVPFDQQPRAYTALVVRGREDAARLAMSLRKGLSSVDGALAPSDVAPLAESIANETARPRALAALLSGFAIFALVLAALGLGGAMASIIAQRQRELAVRMAVGATGTDVMRLLLGDAGRVIGAGLAIGVLMAYGLSRVLSSQLYGVTSSDPATYVMVALVLAAIGLVAAALPGARAARIDPASVLRDG